MLLGFSYLPFPYSPRSAVNFVPWVGLGGRERERGGLDGAADLAGEIPPGGIQLLKSRGKVEFSGYRSFWFGEGATATPAWQWAVGRWAERGSTWRPVAFQSPKVGDEIVWKALRRLAHPPPPSDL